MCYLLVLAVITSGAFFVEPLCTKRKRIFNTPLSLHLSLHLSLSFFPLNCLFCPLLNTMSFLIFSFSYSLSSPFLTPHHTGSLLPSPQLPLPLRLSPLLYCPFSSALSLTVHSTLIFIFSLCLLSFSIFFTVMLFIPLRHCHFVIWCFMGCLNFRNHSFCLSPALLKDSLVFRKLCFFLHWLNTPDCSV